MKYLVNNDKVILDQIFIQLAKVICEDISNPTKELKYQVHKGQGSNMLNQ